MTATEGIPPALLPVPPASDPIIIQSVMRRCFTRTNEFHRSTRAFRNRLVILTLVALSASSLLIIAQWRAHSDAAIVVTPPDAIKLPHWAVLLFVMLFGAIGALITTVPAMIAIPRNPSPFNFPLQQAVLKIVLGTLTAAVGVIAVGESGSSTGYASFTLLLLSATVFGAGQQAVTQFLDKKAGQIVNKAP